VFLFNQQFFESERAGYSRRKTGARRGREAKKSFDMMPKISIVVPNFNNGRYISETLESICNQDYPRKQLIVVDGGSTDMSVDIIREFDKQIDYWISEPDKGQADAIRKGLSFCDGDLFNWINSDDILSPGALEALGRAWRPGKAVAGSVVNFDCNGVLKRVENKGLTIEGICKRDNYILRKSPTSFHQPGFFFDLHCVKQLGVDVDLHYCFDNLLLLRYINTFGQPIYINDIIAMFRQHEHSKTQSQSEKFFEEIVEVFSRLILDSDFSEHKALLEFARAKKEWRNTVRKRPEREGLFEFLSLFWEIMKSPKIRADRFTLSKLKRSLF
jgi:glycosyltransferase involved in cell wall biosynthesis